MSSLEIAPSSTAQVRPEILSPSREQLMAVITIQRRLVEEWIEAFDHEQRGADEQEKNVLALRWMKKYAPAFRAEFDEHMEEHLAEWRKREQGSMGWVWLSNLQARLDERVRRVKTN